MGHPRTAEQTSWPPGRHQVRVRPRKEKPKRRRTTPPLPPPTTLFLVPDLPQAPAVNEGPWGVEWTEVQRSIAERAVETVGDAANKAATTVFLLILEFQRTDDSATEHGKKLLGALHRLLDSYITRCSALDVMKRIHEIGDRLRLDGYSEILDWSATARFVVQKVYAQGYVAALGQAEAAVPRAFTSRSHRP